MSDCVRKKSLGSQAETLNICKNTQVKRLKALFLIMIEDGRNPERIKTNIQTVDIEINGVCNLECPWCWGPEHSPAIETVSNVEWEGILSNLKTKGVQSVVFTGGETLLRKGIIPLMASTKDQGFRVTLSTNGTRKETLREALSVVDDVGIPLDGPDSNINSLMRVPVGRSGLDHFSSVLETIKVFEDFPDVDLTLRTVVSAKNFAYVPEIGKALLSNGVDLNTIRRWKLYQVSPEGPRHDITRNKGWMIPDEVFWETVDRSRLENPQLALSIKGQTAKMSLNRYMLLDPSANVLMIQPDSEGYPMQYMVGNALQNLEEAFENIKRLDMLPTDTTHGI